MSDSKKRPKIPPPDDFSETTPNIDLSGDDDDAGWDRTHYDTPSQTPDDDWGKTIINYDVSALDDDEEDEDPRYSSKSPKEPDWGMTQANVSIDTDFAEEDAGEDEAYGKTTPYFRLPEAEREKYQDLPPTPTEKAREEEQRKRDEGGVPTWFWISAGLMLMFGFAILFLVGAWYIFSGTKGFTVVVNNITPGSKIYVDGSEWSVSRPGNQARVFGLEAGERTIQVMPPGEKCEAADITGRDGDVISYSPRGCQPIQAVDTSSQDCEKTLNEDTREACAEEILDGLENPPDLDRLLRALRLLRINFATNSAEIPGRNKRILTKAAGHIRNLPENVTIEVGGHTDSDGSDDYNDRLSTKRAEAVRAFFISKGVRESRLTSRGYGEGAPVADNDSDEGKARNRRIDYKAIKK